MRCGVDSILVSRELSCIQLCLDSGRLRWAAAATRFDERGQRACPCVAMMGGMRHALEAALAAGPLTRGRRAEGNRARAAGAYIFSGAETPMVSREMRSTVWAALTRVSRAAVRSELSSLRTRQLV